MSTDIGDRLTVQVRRFFDGGDLDGKRHAAFLLVTTDPDGTPRPCMLSAGEVLADGDRALRFALWGGSRTGQNLARGTRALFCFVLADAPPAYVYGTARKLTSPGAAHLECFELVTDRVSTDEHPGMPLTSGLCFDMAAGDVPPVLADWQRQLDLLRHAG